MQSDVSITACRVRCYYRLLDCLHNTWLRVGGSCRHKEKAGTTPSPLALDGVTEDTTWRWRESLQRKIHVTSSTQRCNFSQPMRSSIITLLQTYSWFCRYGNFDRGQNLAKIQLTVNVRFFNRQSINAFYGRNDNESGKLSFLAPASVF